MASDPSAIPALSPSSTATARAAGPWCGYGRRGKPAQLLEQWHPMRIRVRSWSEQVFPVLAMLPAARQALQAAGAEDPMRASNLWFQLERQASTAVEHGITAWRVLRDRWLEAAFELLHAPTLLRQDAVGLDTAQDDCHARAYAADIESTSHNVSVEFSSGCT